MAIGKTVTYFKKCMVCSEMTEYVMRDDDGYYDLSDKEINHAIMVECESQHRFSADQCEKCKMLTKQEVVAWKY